MTFDKTKLAKADVGYPYDIPQIFSYYKESDSLATIEGSAYFDDATNKLQQYDLMYLSGTTGYGYLYQVSSVTGATPVTVRKFDQSGAVIEKIGTFTSVGGAADEDFTITGAVAGSPVLVSLKTPGTNSVSIVRALILSADTLRVTFSADPGNDAEFHYLYPRDIT